MAIDIRGLLLDNLATKGMALFLALLTWFYLYSETTGETELEILFKPEVPDLDFASIRYFDLVDNEIQARGSIHVTLTGPKSDLRTYTHRTVECRPILKPSRFDKAHGEFIRPVTAEDFTLPSHIRIRPTPDPIKVRFVKFVYKQVKVLATLERHVEGEPRPGFKAQSITVVPDEITVKVPADRALNITSVPIRPVKIADFSRTARFPAQIDREQTGFDILPLQGVEVEIVIVPKPSSKRLPVPLHVMMPADFPYRPELSRKEIMVEISGHEELIQKLTPADIFAGVFLNANLSESKPGQKYTLNRFFCHLLDTQVQDTVQIVPLCDMEPAHRHVEVTLLSP